MVGRYTTPSHSNLNFFGKNSFEHSKRIMLNINLSIEIHISQGAILKAVLIVL